MVALPAGILASAFSEQLRLREKMYEDVLDTVYEDGVVDAQEEELLRETRESLEINETAALRIESSKQRAQTSAAKKCCPHCGGAL
jgi:voltage-gated potassium channel